METSLLFPYSAALAKKAIAFFVDDQLQPYDDQWAFLSSIKRLTPEEVQTLLRNVYPAGDVINVRHVATDYDVANDPWLLPPSGRVVDKAITEPLPPNISITLGNLIYVEKKDLSDVFLDRLMRLAAFQNPEFYRAQAMRLSTFGKYRVISCAEDLRHHIALPRGLLKEVLDLFDSHRIAVKVTDLDSAEFLSSLISRRPQANADRGGQGSGGFR